MNITVSSIFDDRLALWGRMIIPPQLKILSTGALLRELLQQWHEVWDTFVFSVQFLDNCILCAHGIQTLLLWSLVTCLLIVLLCSVWWEREMRTRCLKWALHSYGCVHIDGFGSGSSLICIVLMYPFGWKCRYNTMTIQSYKPQGKLTG